MSLPRRQVQPRGFFAHFSIFDQKTCEEVIIMAAQFDGRGILRCRWRSSDRAGSGEAASRTSIGSRCVGA
jgi:hypothetical protein